MDKPNWAELIKRLIECGYTEESIAEAVEATQPTIHYLKTGKTQETKYSTGAGIIRLCTLNGISIHNKKAPVTANN
ncbi:PIN domain-containing protein [Acinetobacter seifertii]|uniref:Uncharacterized protein n=1 Tax=Acinetobacter seifertii TaxID=1530123 RepID=A0ABX8L6L4_9GAMM|nr:hypothetical protein [Acinetobacter seifertii]QXB47686.1 hypothetical protein I6L30_06715 [Acinetobacter seifertii]